MLLAVEKAPGQILNLGGGRGFSIKELVETIVEQLDEKPKVVWDATKPAGDKKRIMDISRARAIGFEPRISLAEGIKDTMAWYKSNSDQTGKRYDVFNTPSNPA